MEILQTIWSALTTENEFIMKLISIPFTFIELAITILLSDILLNLNISKKNIIIYILSSSLVSILSSFLLSDTLKVIINIIYTPLFAVFVLKINFFKGLLIEFLPIVFMLISETIFFNFANIVFGITSDKFSFIPLYRIIIAIVNYTFLLIICLLAKKFKINIKIFGTFSKKTAIVLTINFIIGLVAVITQIYLVTFYLKILPLFISIIGLISLLAYFFISMYSLVNTSKLALTSTNLE